MLLAIDTSTELTGLACYAQHCLLGECTWYSGRNHTAQLLAQLDLLLAHLGRSAADVGAVGVALGPGSWSGLRVGMSFAKGIALAADVPLLGIGTLDALAYQHQQPALPVYPLVRLGRARFATACFRHTAGGQRVGDYATLTLDALGQQIGQQPDEAVFFCGDTDAAVQAQLQALLGEQARFAPVAANLRRPGFLAELAWQRFVAGEHDSLAQLEPLYLGEAVKPQP
ncbi:MAG: tRNA (adenosine(37)-N6)-threonylcarbamoyltransferase complex dimerization subunit type 1 TsaB [Blastochloris sp.]|nr:tRNA (adenosine(37)-N6)-threonylcarbamoyltransferase complex dimerization subunit type 1 TsaB [Blastochloris sp.]